MVPLLRILPVPTTFNQNHTFIGMYLLCSLFISMFQRFTVIRSEAAFTRDSIDVNTQTGVEAAFRPVY